jgi:hypothetical protein
MYAKANYFYKAYIKNPDTLEWFECKKEDEPSINYSVVGSFGV